MQLFALLPSPAQRTNSLVYGLVNNGTEEFPTNVASITNFAKGCMRDYKNSPNPVHVRVSYIAKTLKISVDTHSKGRKMVGCFEHPDVDLPTGYHFGFSVCNKRSKVSIYVTASKKLTLFTCIGRVSSLWSS